MLHITTEGLLRKWRNMFSMSFSAHSLKKRWYPFGSTIIMNPISSHSSTSSGAGMLWEVRMASQPMSFSSVSWRRRAALLTAAPSGPRSWWLHTPWNLRGLPLSINPLSATMATERMPKRVAYSSTNRSPS